MFPLLFCASLFPPIIYTTVALLLGSSLGSHRHNRISSLLTQSLTPFDSSSPPGAATYVAPSSPHLAAHKPPLKPSSTRPLTPFPRVAGAAPLDAALGTTHRHPPTLPPRHHDGAAQRCGALVHPTTSLPPSLSLSPLQSSRPIDHHHHHQVCSSNAHAGLSGIDPTRPSIPKKMLHTIRNAHRWNDDDVNAEKFTLFRLLFLNNT